MAQPLALISPGFPAAENQLLINTGEAGAVELFRRLSSG